MSTLSIVLALIAPFAWLGLPSLLRTFGLHPHYSGPLYTLPGKRALIITTSQATLGAGGKATGVFGSEMTAPYYAFLDAGMQVDIASIQGGSIATPPTNLMRPHAAQTHNHKNQHPPQQY